MQNIKKWKVTTEEEYNFCKALLISLKNIINTFTDDDIKQLQLEDAIAITRDKLNQIVIEIKD